MYIKSLFMLLATFCCLTSAFGQFNVGPKIGTNNSYIFNNSTFDIQNGDRKYGFQGGVFTRAEFLFLFIQPEALFMSGSGQLTAQNDLGQDILIDYEFDRMDFPIFAGFRLGKGIRIGVGPVFSVLLNDSFDGNGNSNFSFDNSSVGFLAGIGIDVWNLVFDLRYEGALGEINDSFLGVDADQRVNQLTFSVGLKLFSPKEKKSNK